VIVEKPWGKVTTYALNQPSSVRMITIEPGQETSEHYHQLRDEMWVVLDPGLVLQIGPRKLEPQPGDEFVVTAEESHRIKNTGDRRGRGRHARRRHHRLGAERLQQARQRDRLREHGHRAERSGLSLQLRIRRAGHHHDPDRPVERADPLDRVEAAEARHQEVQDDPRRPRPFDLDQRLQPVRRLDDVEPFAAEEFDDRLAHVAIVVDHQDSRRAAHWPKASRPVMSRPTIRVWMS